VEININPDSSTLDAMTTGLYPYYANGYVYIIYGIIGTPKLAYFKYNPDTLAVVTPGGHDTTIIFDIGVNFSQTTQFAFYNNYLYYSIKGPTPSIGRLLIRSTSGSDPTFSNNNNSYIDSDQLGSSTGNPTGITCDNGNLYVIMGDTRKITLPSGTDNIEILKFDLDESPPTRSVLCTINAILYGMPISLFFDNIDNIIYIGTYCGEYCEYSGTILTSQKGATKGVGMILTYYLDILKFFCYSTGVGSMFRINYDGNGDMLYIGTSNLTLTGYREERIRPPRTPERSASVNMKLYKISLFKKSNFNFYNSNIANQNNELFSMLDGPYTSKPALFNVNGISIPANYSLKNRTIVSRIDTSYNNTNATTYHGINTGFYVFRDNFYWDVMNFFTLSNTVTGIISPTVSTLSPIPDAIGLCCSTPHKFSYIFTVDGSSSNNDQIGTYTIYGAGTYYLLINGILSPFYKTTIAPNTGSFVYINGKNHIEIFTNGSVIASFNMPNITTITSSTGASTLGNTLYTSTSWAKNQQTSYIKNILSNIGAIFLSNDEKLFCLISGGLTVKVYNKNVDFTYTTTSGSTSLNNIAYYYDITNATNTPASYNRYIKNIYIDSAQSFLSPNLSSGVTKWGYKIVGYFLPDKTGNWIFDLYADAGQFCIGSDNGDPTFINPNIGGSPQCFSMNETSDYPSSPTEIIMTMNYKTNDRYGTITSSPSSSVSPSPSVSSRVTVQLKSGIYYPILLYYGGGNKKLQLIFTDPNNTVYTPSNSPTPDSRYASFLYRVNIFPTY
jgi:hypothetical protein